LPKDTRALVHIAETAGYDFAMLRGAIASNDEHMARVLAKVSRAAGGSINAATIALWGLTFKAGTDDRRESPALSLARQIALGGGKIRAYDPTVDRMPRATAHGRAISPT